MSDYQRVQTALAEGAEPRMLCATCPWDRNCITPPSMTKAEVDAEVARASEKDEERSAEKRAAGEDPGLPMGALLMTLTLSGKESSASCCPVLALRLRTSAGRSIVDSLKAQMSGWDDER